MYDCNRVIPDATIISDIVDRFVYAHSGFSDPVFDETQMRRILGKYIHDGETLLAGIHAISHETNIRGIFGKCDRTERGLIPDENGSIIVLNPPPNPPSFGNMILK